MILISFSISLLLFVIIGSASALQSKQSHKDYLLAGQSVSPWLVALSAVATNNSGYMFIGMIGFTYTQGLSSMWLMLGWIIGDLIMSFIVHSKLRVITERRHVLSFGGVLSSWTGVEFKKLRSLIGLITILFLGTYAAAQLNAGGKALHVLLDWPYSAGAIISAVIVMLYCFAGGIRASIWTDAAQSLVMIVAMVSMFVAGIMKAGGMGEFVSKVSHISPTYTDLFPHDLALTSPMGPLLFVLGWLFAGFGIIGQPHIMVRFMTLDTPKNMSRVRLYYYSWFTLFYAITIGVGLAARVLISQESQFDPELALPLLAQMLLPEFMVGLVLAGLFAATMSTADSQILSCTAALTRDFQWGKKASYLVTKLGTIMITLIALMIALYGNKSVFSLVLIAWSVLASSFGPLLFLYAIGLRPNEGESIVMVVTGFLVVILWRHWGFSEIIYEIAPGMVSGLMVYGLMRLTTPVGNRNVRGSN